MLLVGNSVIRVRPSGARAAVQPLRRRGRERHGAWHRTAVRSWSRLWATQLEETLQTYDADIVLFESCCHYPGGPRRASPLYVNDQGITVQPGTELMYTELAKANTELSWNRPGARCMRRLDQAPADHRRVDHLRGPTSPSAWTGSTCCSTSCRRRSSTGVPPCWRNRTPRRYRHPDGIRYTDASNAFLARWTFTQTVRVVAPGT
ncbi:MAG: hypothetical protein R2699_10665 [Acidimicrobiales bacterium]